MKAGRQPWMSMVTWCCWRAVALLLVMSDGCYCTGVKRYTTVRDETGHHLPSRISNETVVAVVHVRGSGRPSGHIEKGMQETVERLSNYRIGRATQVKTSSVSTYGLWLWKQQYQYGDSYVLVLLAAYYHNDDLSSFTSDKEAYAYAEPEVYTTANMIFKSLKKPCELEADEEEEEVLMQELGKRTGREEGLRLRNRSIYKNSTKVKADEEEEELWANKVGNRRREGLRLSHISIFKTLDVVQIMGESIIVIVRPHSNNALILRIELSAYVAEDHPIDLPSYNIPPPLDCIRVDELAGSKVVTVTKLLQKTIMYAMNKATESIDTGKPPHRSTEDDALMWDAQAWHHKGWIVKVKILYTEEAFIEVVFGTLSKLVFFTTSRMVERFEEFIGPKQLIHTSFAVVYVPNEQKQTKLVIQVLIRQNKGILKKTKKQKM